MSFKGLKMLKIPKLPDFEKYWKSSKNIQRGDPWKKNFLVFFLTLYFTQDNHTRLLECHLEVFECWKAQNWPNVTHSPLCRDTLEMWAAVVPTKDPSEIDIFNRYKNDFERKSFSACNHDNDIYYLLMRVVE